MSIEPPMQSTGGITAASLAELREKLSKYRPMRQGQQVVLVSSNPETREHWRVMFPNAHILEAVRLDEEGAYVLDMDKANETMRGMLDTIGFSARSAMNSLVDFGKVMERNSRKLEMGIVAATSWDMPEKICADLDDGKRHVFRDTKYHRPRSLQKSSRQSQRKSRKRNRA